MYTANKAESKIVRELYKRPSLTLYIYNIGIYIHKIILKLWHLYELLYMKTTMVACQNEKAKDYARLFIKQ